MRDARKIILHGLWRDKIDQLLLKNHEFFFKSYWFMWGGDFYFPERQTKDRSLVIKNIGNLVTGVLGDIDYVRQHYSAKGSYHSCFLYPSNIFKPFSTIERSDGSVNILVGNSASPDNNHFSTFEILEKYKQENIKIFVPLSYGDRIYANNVIEHGNSIFQEKFLPISRMMDYSDYLIFLSSIDVALFNHNRQQAMGNTINLLGLGKRVFMRSDVPQWAALNEIGAKVYDIKNFQLFDSDLTLCNKNIITIQKYFSEFNLADSLRTIFDFVD